MRNRVDTWLTNRFGILNSRQNTYFANHGKYFQGLLTHTVTPNHTASTTADITADRLALHPTDQLESWLDAIPTLDGEVLAGAIAIDVFNGPRGQGWVLTVYVRYNGTTYRRIKAVGAETERDESWAVYDNP